MEFRQHWQAAGTPLRPTAVAHAGGASIPARLGVEENVVIPTQPDFQSQPTQARRASVAGPSTHRRCRKERSQNWRTPETLVLINAKRQQHFEEKSTVDKRDLMIPDVTKWMRIADIVMRVGFSPSVRDGPACKTKWNQLVPDYKRISDYLGRSRQNVKDYWDLTADERVAEGLPKQFSEEFFAAIHEWYCTRPQINPMHLRDVLSPNDSNFLPDLRCSQLQRQEATDSESEDPIRVAANQSPINLSTDDSSQPPHSQQQQQTTHNKEPPLQQTGPSTPRAFSTVPPQVKINILSSSENAASASQQRPGNTGVKRKNVTGHAIIAEATKSTGVVMASQMKTIADASLQVERRKIEVQMRLFQEHMSYQRDRDLRLYETALLTHDNARLAILKQQEMVHCLQNLTAVLGAGLSTQTSAQRNVPTTQPQTVSSPAAADIPRNINIEPARITVNSAAATIPNGNTMTPPQNANSAENAGDPHLHGFTPANGHL